MKSLIHLVNRHIHLFRSSPFALVITCMSACIILALYFLFIKDFMIIALNDYGIKEYDAHLVDCIMFAGLLLVVNATSILSVLSIYIQDKNKGIDRDFYISPTSSTTILTSYVIASILCSLFISLLSFLCIQVYFHYAYDFHFTASQYTNILLLLSMNSSFSTILLFSIAIFIYSFSAFASISNLFSVCIGFVNGVYIPFAMYPSAIQSIFKHFPFTQLTTLMRQVFTQDILEKCAIVYPKEAILQIKEHFAITLNVDYDLYVSISCVLFLSFFLLLCLHTCKIIYDRK